MLHKKRAICLSYLKLLIEVHSMNITYMTAIEISKAIRQKQISAADAVNAFFEQIEKTDNKLNAYITICKEKAFKKAEQIQKKIDSGELITPVAGVPFAVKDNICTKDIKTTCGSKLLENFIPAYNATVIDRLESEGAIIIGKSNMDEFAMGSACETSFFGAVKNPHNITKSAGGSSGGSAAAVAALSTPFALGSDSGGSIRLPASFCGVTGFKPTYGTVSRYGLVAYAASFDQIGVIAKDVLDCATVTGIIAGHDKYDSVSLKLDKQISCNTQKTNVKGLKIGVPLEYFSHVELNDNVKNLVHDAGYVDKGLGADIVDISLPLTKYLVPTYYIIATAQASSDLARYDGVKYGHRSKNYNSLSELYNSTRSEGFGYEAKKRILLGTYVLSTGYYDDYYKKALQARALIVKQFDNTFNDIDLILCPTAPCSAPHLGESAKTPLKMYLSDIYTVAANLAGLPALSMPCGYDENNMPVGVQLMGARLNDNNVLDAGFVYQQVTQWHKHFAQGV